jgi:hypothetical protein
MKGGWCFEDSNVNSNTRWREGGGGERERGEENGRERERLDAFKSERDKPYGTRVQGLGFRFAL